MLMLRSGVALIALTCFGSAALADVPASLHYQGYLTDSVGTPVHCPDLETCPDGMKKLSFALYDSKDALEAVWIETHYEVPVYDGVFNIELGSTTPLETNSLAGGIAYLGIAIDNGDELEPRQVIVSSAYAIYAGSTDHASDSDSLGGVDADQYTTEDEVLGLCVTPEELEEQSYCKTCYTDEDVAAYLELNGYPGALSYLSVLEDGSLAFNGTPIIDAEGEWLGSLAGLAGPKGDKGDPGEQGADGAAGEKGDPGQKGDKGDPGEQGADGAAGEKGDPGQKGEQGPQGPPGVTNLVHKTSSTAYDIGPDWITTDIAVTINVKANSKVLIIASVQGYSFANNSNGVGLMRLARDGAPLPGTTVTQHTGHTSANDHANTMTLMTMDTLGNGGSFTYSVQAKQVSGPFRINQVTDSSPSSNIIAQEF